MEEDISKVLNDAYQGAFPYLSDTDWIKEFISLLTEKTKIEEIVTALQEMIKKEAEIGKKTDLKVYLTYLGKVAKKYV